MLFVEHYRRHLMSCKNAPTVFRRRILSGSHIRCLNCRLQNTVLSRNRLLYLSNGLHREWNMHYDSGKGQNVPSKTGTVKGPGDFQFFINILCTFCLLVNHYCCNKWTCGLDWMGKVGYQRTELSGAEGEQTCRHHLLAGSWISEKQESSKSTLSQATVDQTPSGC